MTKISVRVVALRILKDGAIEYFHSSKWDNSSSNILNYTSDSGVSSVYSPLGDMQSTKEYLSNVVTTHPFKKSKNFLTRFSV